MTIIETISNLRSRVQKGRNGEKTIGLVPTMGALHDGHAQLVRQCVAENDICVVSVFVNPTQFNNPEDLRLYPRSPEKDYQLLETLGVDIIFSPSVEEMYPVPDERCFDFGEIDKVMEGVFRPGHFNGVAQVVSKLFELVEPHTAYFGEKDFQQLAIVKEMVVQLNLPVEIIAVPTVREESGLALSSRNQRLSDDERRNASSIYRILREGGSLISSKSPEEITEWVVDEINKVPGLRVEYFSIVNATSLQAVSSWEDAGEIVGCVAAYCGDVRLIDNIKFK